nr:MAG TPA: hypothetical protein [Bacteriophage sp.]
MLDAHLIEKKTTHLFFICLLALQLKIQQMIQSN